MKLAWMLRWLPRTIVVTAFIFVISVVQIALKFGGPISSRHLLIYYVAIPIISVIGISFLISYVWAHLYWKRYRFDVGKEDVNVRRGVIRRRRVTIPYERIQNVNIWQGIPERICGLYIVEIETAAGSWLPEGDIEGVTNPEPIVDFIIRKAKGGKGL
jgi:putative membrane protein